MRTGYRVCDAMTRKPIAVEPDTSIVECAKIMKKNGIGSLVIKEDEQLKGYLTEHQIVHAIVAANKDPSKIRAEQIMSTNVPIASPNQDIYDALIKMRDADVRQLPVVDGQKLVGLLTQKDVLKIQPQLFELIAEKISLREEEHKPIFTARPIEGTCDRCGEFSERIYEIDGVFLCKDCKMR